MSKLFKKLLGICFIILLLCGSSMVYAQSTIQLSATKKVLNVGNSYELVLSGAKNGAWSTSNKNVASIKKISNTKYKVTAKKKGTANINVKVGNKTYSCKITVESPKLNTTSSTIHMGKNIILKVSGTTQKVSWTSSNKDIATVSSLGKVTAKKSGKTIIKVKVGNQSWNVKITVKGHKWKLKSSKSATCKKTGKKVYTCTQCNKTKTTRIPKKTTHTWGSWGIAEEADCETEGEKERFCKYCNKRDTQVIKKTSHMWGTPRTIKESTCETQGVLRYYCRTCDTTKDVKLSVIEHDLDNGKITVQPTCTEDGLKVYTCTMCDKVIKTVTIKASHDYEDTGKIDANGNHEQICSVCGDVKNPVDEDKGVSSEHQHTWGTGVVTKEATCEDKGVKTYTCSGCGKTKTESIDTIEHNYEKYTYTEPTCTSKGLTIMRCTVCKSTVGNIEEIPALGHILDTSCSGLGVLEKKVVTCQRDGCDYITKIYHQYNDLTKDSSWTVTKQPKDGLPTSESDFGERVYKCSVCGGILFTQSIVNIDVGNGKIESVCGEFDDSMVEKQIDEINEYRSQFDGLNPIREDYDEYKFYAKIRAAEFYYVNDRYSDIRANGESYTTLDTTNLVGMIQESRGHTGLTDYEENEVMWANSGIREWTTGEGSAVSGSLKYADCVYMGVFKVVTRVNVNSGQYGYGMSIICDVWNVDWWCYNR